MRVGIPELEIGERLPDYAGAGVVNLMQSVAVACGAAGPGYPPLGLALPRALGEARNLVLLVIDGMGDALLQAAGQGTQLLAHRAGTLTSVFPSTTATAVTTLLTGLAPAQHGLTGWHMYFAEAGSVLAVLPLTRRVARPVDREWPALPLLKALFDQRGLFASLGRRSHVVSPAAIADSAFNRFHTAGAIAHAYGVRGELFDCIADIARQGVDRQYVYAYYDGLDSLSHRVGAYGEAAGAELCELDAGFARLLALLDGSDTTLLVTADHGFIDSPETRGIDLAQHPKLEAMLTQPLCGEPRLAYCQVAAERQGAFEAYVARKLGHAARCVRSDALIGAGWFGPGTPNPRLAGRVGSHTLVMRENWTIRDWLPGERRYRQIGVHGGVSTREMQVPLIFAHC
jgi:hypothetical protein